MPVDCELEPSSCEAHAEIRNAIAENKTAENARRFIARNLNYDIIIRISNRFRTASNSPDCIIDV
ncbi:MAG: hypothetical protein DME66_07495 [Verrucomicrobia bacterium]|nr:MAG: hypothetical protein DME66_07495 [Verrucomicrobiota bacterium]